MENNKKIKETLWKNEDFYYTLYVGSQDSIMILNPIEKGFLSGNPATIKLFACKDENDFIARTPASLSPQYQPDGALSTDKSQEMIRLSIEKGSHFFEWTHRRVDGVDFPATVLLSLIESDGIQLVQATVRDITELKKIEKTLQDSEKRYKTLFSGATEGILVADLQAKQFLYCNVAICKMLGYTEKELISLGVMDIHPKKDLDYVLSEFDSLARGEKKFTEIPCLRKDGTVFSASVTESKIVIDEKECVLGFFTDITERKRAEDIIKRKYEEIEKMNEFLLDRESRVIELKKENEELKNIISLKK